MNVAEVKALEPLAEVYELKPDTKYIMLFEGDGRRAEPIAAALKDRGVDNVVVMSITDISKAKIVGMG